MYPSRRPREKTNAAIPSEVARRGECVRAHTFFRWFQSQILWQFVFEFDEFSGISIAG